MSVRPPDGIDWPSFAASLMQPRRPRLAEVAAAARALAREAVRAAGAGTADARSAALTEPAFLDEAWERLTARFDALDLYADPRRGFLPLYPPSEFPMDQDPRPGRGDPLRPWAQGSVSGVFPSDRLVARRPWELEAMVAFLSADRADLIRAEELCLVGADRLLGWCREDLMWADFFATWGPFAEPRMALWFLAPSWLPDGPLAPGCYRRPLTPRVSFELRNRLLADGLAETVADVDAVSDAILLPTVNGPVRLAGSAAATDARAFVAWDRLEAGPNPFEPTLMAWGLGYFPGRVFSRGVGVGLPWTEERDGYVTARSWGGLARAAARGAGLRPVEKWR